MTKEVTTVPVTMPLRAVARTLSVQRISGTPVVDEQGKVVGVVSEGDIIRKLQGLTPDKGGLFDWIFGTKKEPAAKLAARTAGEAMTAPPVTIEPDSTVSDAARLMSTRQINRLPVLENGELVGIVTRADLVRAFDRSDEDLSEEITHDVLVRTLWIDPQLVSVRVEQGEVWLAGQVETRTESELVVGFVRRVPGVVDVHSELTWEIDDLERHLDTQELAHRLR
jgi:CBS domain-containing protein